MQKKTALYRMIGLMSGTSVDGLDMADCTFYQSGGRWKYEILHAETLEYPKELKAKLSAAHLLPADALMVLDTVFGKFCGQAVKQFAARYRIKPLALASHGHTVLHRPDLGYTLQIGKGAVMAEISGFDTVSDFRSQDVALGGQGAPLVPVGDQLLFPEYGKCLNIGGFCNISVARDRSRLAWDIAPANIVLNELAAEAGQPFDTDGQLAASGTVIREMYNALQAPGYFRRKPPKSLGREWVETHYRPILQKYAPFPVADRLRTYTEFLAVQILKTGNRCRAEGPMLVTGGGGLNTFLIERIRQAASFRLDLPDPRTIAFKEALIFAFLGLLRLLGEVNCLASVTGAKRDHCTGVIYKNQAS